MAARGYVFKRCKQHGITGSPARGSKPAVPACACKYPAGRWTWRAEGAVDPASGKRTQPSKGGFETKKLADQALTEYLSETDAGRGVTDRRLTVEAWLRRWLAEAEQRLEPGTVKGYRRDVHNHLIPRIGSMRLRELRHWHVEEMLAAIGTPGTALPERPEGARRGGSTVEQRSPRTVDGVRRTLRASLARAKARGLIRDNPAEGTMESIPKGGRAKAAYWQPAHLARFLASVAGDPLYSLWVTAAYTGLRREELLGLMVDDLELAPAGGDHWPGLVIRRRLTGDAGLWPCPVCGTAHRGRQLRENGKTETSARWVPLTEQARVALVGQLEHLQAMKARVGAGWVEHRLVWPSELGEPLRPDWVTKRFGELVAAQGLPKVTLHSMRHGMVSMVVGATGSMEHASQLVGHASVGVTREVYAHGMRSVLASHADAVAELVARALPAASSGSSSETAEVTVVAVDDVPTGSPESSDRDGYDQSRSDLSAQTVHTGNPRHDPEGAEIVV
jgi:integrase